MTRLIAISCLTALLLTQAEAPAAAQGRAARVEALKEEIAKVRGKIDSSLMQLFRNQVDAAVFRSRISALQKEWTKLFAAIGGRRKLATLRPPPANGFRLAEVTTSDADGLEAALATPACKKKRNCRIWARIAFGKELLKKGAPFEVSAELKSKSGRRYAVPGKELTVGQAVMVVDLSIQGAGYISKGTYTGKLKVMCDGRYKAKPFEFQLLNTY